MTEETQGPGETAKEPVRADEGGKVMNAASLSKVAREQEKRQDNMEAELSALSNTVAEGFERLGSNMEIIVKQFQATQEALAAPGAETTATVEFDDDNKRHVDAPEVEVDEDDLGLLDDVKKDAEWLAMEAFMHEEVLIEISPTAAEIEDPIVFLAMNGKRFWIPRGVPVHVPRYLVEILMTAQPYNYRDEEYIDAQGTRRVRNPRVSGLRYPFQVHHDPSGEKGLKWRMKMQADNANKQRDRVAA